MPISRRPRMPAFLACAAVLGMAPLAVHAQDAVSDAEENQALADTRSACAQQDFHTFLQYYIGSAAVRQRYTAAQVEQRSFAQPQKAGRAIAAADMSLFRVGQLDWNYADAASLKQWEANPDQRYQLLDVTFTELPGGGRKVVYQPGVFHDDGEGDSMTLVRRTGKPAAYVFGWQNGCWQLTQDLR